MLAAEGQLQSQAPQRLLDSTPPASQPQPLALCPSQAGNRERSCGCPTTTLHNVNVGTVFHRFLLTPPHHRPSPPPSTIIAPSPHATSLNTQAHHQYTVSIANAAIIVAGWPRLAPPLPSPLRRAVPRAYTRRASVSVCAPRAATMYGHPVVADGTQHHGQ